MPASWAHEQALWLYTHRTLVWKLCLKLLLHCFFIQYFCCFLFNSVFKRVVIHLAVDILGCDPFSTKHSLPDSICTLSLVDQVNWSNLDFSPTFSPWSVNEAMISSVSFHCFRHLCLLLSWREQLTVFAFLFQFLLLLYTWSPNLLQPDITVLVDWAWNTKLLLTYSMQQ